MNTDTNNIDTKLLSEEERIDAYLKGKMSNEEEQQFMQELNDIPELKAKAIAMARLVKGLKEVGAEQDLVTQSALLASTKESVELAAKNAIGAQEELGLSAACIPAAQRMEQQEEQTQVAAKNVFTLRKAITLLSIAASVAIIIWLGVEYSIYRNTTALGYQYGDAFSSGTIIRGVETPSEAEKKLDKLFADVKNDENIDNAIHELSLCWELSTMETYNDYTNYAPEIGWNLAIAYLKDNDKKGASAVLSKMAELYDADTAVGEKVRELQEKMK